VNPPAPSGTGDTPVILPREEWGRRREEHIHRTERWTAPHLLRRSLHQSHPVHDFLFDYYSQRPSLLARWHPGIGHLLGGDAREFLRFTGYREMRGGIGADPATLPPGRVHAIRRIAALLETTATRPPQFGCSGLHEWAMVYRATDIRHGRIPLRLSPAEIDGIVETLPIRCTHHDAFRFFTPGAIPLNRHRPAREDAIAIEQSGCLHTNMDLYKWSYKLAPFVPSELSMDAFELAAEIREIDMRASPYDLRALGYEPIPIETPGGRIEYETQQRAFAASAQPIRLALLGVCRAVLEAAGSKSI